MMAGNLKLTWYDDLKAESDLRRMSVIYSKVAIQFSRIDLKESQVNGARLNDAIRHHKVEDYMQGFRNGDTFPRIVVVKTPTGYVILSGNQRMEAIRRLIEAGELPKSVEVEAYLVDTKDKLLLEIIARSANASHGEGDTKEERIQQAMYCHKRLGLSVKDAAKSFLVSDTAIHQNLKAEEVRNKLQRAGVDAHSASIASLVPLAKLDYDESSQMKLGTLAVQHSVPSERIKQVASTVAKQTSAQGRIQKIREFEKELADSAHASNGHSRGHIELERSKVPLRPRRDKLISLLSRLSNFLESENAGEPFRSLEELQVTTQSDREKVNTLGKKVRNRLGVILK